MQGIANLGLQAPKWPESVEGTYLRIDIPLIVPLLLKWMEGQQTGKALTLRPPPGHSESDGNKRRIMHLLNF